ncbi:NHL repeat-containing protein [Streptomyces griseus]|uniref:hypothetical protein n=1 Tax=Streptomyces griseus TaxID=1911 RepID=UPI00365FBFE4
MDTIGLSRPIGLALTANGDLYIADSFNDRGVELPAGGGPQRTVPATGLNSPYGLAFDPAGALYIADFDNDRVVKLPVRGGQRTQPVAGLRAPAGPAVPPGRDAY